MATREDRPDWDPDHLRRRLQAMDDFQFEHLVADLWGKQGWNTEVEQQSGDAGIDVRATKVEPYPRKALIQAKRYSDKNPVGGPAIQQYSALKQQERDVDEAIIVTTGRFTGSAEDRAQDLNVKTIDGNGLTSLIDNLDAYSLVEGYIGQPNGSNSTPEAGNTTTVDQQTDRISRKKLEEVVGQDLDQFLQDEQYRATRAMEKAKGNITLNPHDAKKIGLFEEVPNGDQLERSFEQNKEKLIVFKDDVHMDSEGEIYIEDVTQYIGADAIKGEQSGPIIGVLQRGVSDGVWMSEKGETLLRYKNQKQWLISGAKGAVASLRESNRTEETVRGEGQSSTEIISSQTSQTPWFYGAVVGTVGWLLAWVVGGLGAPAAVVGLLVLIAWPTLPVSIGLDSRQSGFLSASKKESIAYIGLSVVPVLALFPGAVYLYRRNRFSS